MNCHVCFYETRQWSFANYLMTKFELGSTGLREKRGINNHKNHLSTVLSSETSDIRRGSEWPNDVPKSRARIMYLRIANHRREGLRSFSCTNSRIMLLCGIEFKGTSQSQESITSTFPTHSVMHCYPPYHYFLRPQRVCLLRIVLLYC